MYARVSPEHKIRIVRAWQEKENIVAMTGDGVNDAPALKQADIGVAMGVTGTEVAKDAAAMVLTDDNFATIVKAVENGRNLYQNIKYAIQFLCQEILEQFWQSLYASVAGLPVPFAPVHLLFINLLTDSLPAIALGVEPHSSEVMNEKPRSVNESILTKEFLGENRTGRSVIGMMTMTGFLTGYTRMVQCWEVRWLLEHFVWHVCFMDLTANRIIRSSLQNVSLIINGFREHLYLGTVLITAVLTIPGLHVMFKVVTLNMTQLDDSIWSCISESSCDSGLLKYLKGKTKWN